MHDYNRDGGTGRGGGGHSNRRMSVAELRARDAVPAL
jgi:hypothetical protein